MKYEPQMSRGVPPEPGKPQAKLILEFFILRVEDVASKRSALPFQTIPTSPAG